MVDICLRVIDFVKNREQSIEKIEKLFEKLDVWIHINGYITDRVYQNLYDKIFHLSLLDMHVFIKEMEINGEWRDREVFRDMLVIVNHLLNDEGRLSSEIKSTLLFPARELTSINTPLDTTPITLLKAH